MQSGVAVAAELGPDVRPAAQQQLHDLVVALAGVKEEVQVAQPGQHVIPEACALQELAGTGGGAEEPTLSQPWSLRSGGGGKGQTTQQTRTLGQFISEKGKGYGSNAKGWYRQRGPPSDAVPVPTT